MSITVREDCQQTMTRVRHRIAEAHQELATLLRLGAAAERACGPEDQQDATVLGRLADAVQAGLATSLDELADTEAALDALNKLGAHQLAADGIDETLTLTRCVTCRRVHQLADLHATSWGEVYCEGCIEEESSWWTCDCDECATSGSGD